MLLGITLIRACGGRTREEYDQVGPPGWGPVERVELWGEKISFTITYH